MAPAFLVLSSWVTLGSNFGHGHNEEMRRQNAGEILQDEECLESTDCEYVNDNVRGEAPDFVYLSHSPHFVSSNSA